MLKKNDIKLIRSLRLKKYRQKYNKFIVEGEKNSIEAIKNDFDNIEKIFCLEEYYIKNQKLLDDYSFEIIIVSNKQLDQISNLKTANSVVLVMNSKEDIDPENLNKNSIIVYLDDITDPGNMGTIIRTCDWFGIDALVVSPVSVDIHNSKVIRSSMGSIFRLPIIELEYDKLRRILHGFDFTYYGTKLEGDDIGKINYNSPMVIVIGNESRGISKVVDDTLDCRITIPRFNDLTESLNAAVATAIVLYEVKKENRII